MNVEKAKKRIAKQIRKGSNGYPMLEIEYFGKDSNCATEVTISLALEQGAEPQAQKFVSETDVREDETIQSTIVKIIERVGANTVSETEGVTLI